jgi:hypothetical protein
MSKYNIDKHALTIELERFVENTKTSNIETINFYIEQLKEILLKSNRIKSKGL